VVGLTIVLLVVGYGSKPIFFLFTLLIIFLVLKEFYDLPSCGTGSKISGIALGLALTGGFYALDKPSLVALMAGIGCLLCFLVITGFQNKKNSTADIEKHFIGIYIITFLLSHFIWLRDLTAGKQWIFFLFSVVFAGDTFALYGGKFCGHHRLASRISPGKTVEGTIIGLIGNCVGGVLFAFFFLSGFSIRALLLLSVVLGVLGQLGDLWESILKREANVKDSGWLLPGHGGFLDRVDSMLFTTPFLYYFILVHAGAL